MFLGIIAGVVLVPICLLGWFWFGKVPVAVADPPIPHERMITGIPLHARIDRELVKKVPIMLDEDNLVAGAHVYREQCSVCHGFHGKPASIGTHMFPAAPQLWERHNNSDVVGVSDDAPGETYWKVVNGIRLTGMPAYKSLLTDSEIWQVSLLLSNADKPLPPGAVDILRGDGPPVSSSSPATGSALQKLEKKIAQ